MAESLRAEVTTEESSEAKPQAIQARRASECVHWAHHEMHALAGASGL